MFSWPSCNPHAVQAHLPAFPSFRMPWLIIWKQKYNLRANEARNVDLVHNKDLELRVAIEVDDSNEDNIRVAPMHGPTVHSPPSHLKIFQIHLQKTLHFKQSFGSANLPSTIMEESTRIFVSGLPPAFSNDQLKKHFSTRFQTTDAHVLPKRRIGFVGFKSPEVAKEAVNYFNKTYVKMSKISVEIARPVCLWPLPLILSAAVHADPSRWSWNWPEFL